MIVYMESKPKWKHFISDGDFPIWGDPKGYGLMQLDNPRATDEQVWNWKANRAAGQALFAIKKSWATSYPSVVRSWGGVYRYASNYTQQEFLTDAFQLYNGWHYWIWKPYFKKFPFLGGYWDENPRVRRDYGGTAIKIYNNVQNGNPPTGW